MGDNYFILSRETEIKFEGTSVASVPIVRAIKRLRRDIQRVITGGAQIKTQVIVSLIDSENLEPETFKITFSPDHNSMKIQGKNELGVIYGLLYISETYLNITPFWFWDDHQLNTFHNVEVPSHPYTSRPFNVRFRGWFVNDEVLLLGWKNNPNDPAVWEAVFEALLRCGGNMVIPGTDTNSKINRQLASDMGLWLTHHHAEPLGAEMFSRKYPGEQASYSKNPILFESLWREAIKEQKDLKIIWNIGFRGQGDRPFWADDPLYTDSASRGDMISTIMKRQVEIVQESVKKPMFCTNLYGEIMELYQDGYLTFPEDVIKIWADSGYGKMVSRRQGNHNPRVPSLPKKQDQGPHGLYYHVTFYDLQASNHLTMLPNSPYFVAQELQQAFQREATEFLIVNSGNIKPHTYFLDLVSHLWKEGAIDVNTHLHQFIEKRYTSHKDDIYQIYQAYFQSTLQYGKHLDEKAGEQYYHYSARRIVDHWLKGEGHQTNQRLIWATGEVDFNEQIDWFLEKTQVIEEKWGQLYQKALAVSNELIENERQHFLNSILLQIRLHDTGCKGLIHLCKSYKSYVQQDYLHSFIDAVEGKAQFEAAMSVMNQRQQGEWENFYRNDCLTNVELTAYCLDALVKYIRVVGDGPNFYEWEKKYLYSDADKNVVLITNFSKPLTDESLNVQLQAITPS